MLFVKKIVAEVFIARRLNKGEKI